MQFQSSSKTVQCVTLAKRLFSVGLVSACLNALLLANDKVIVLTFDDAVKSHRSYVAPLLKELGFGATFFVTYRWMEDEANFMSWEDIREIHEMGFEIGNHTSTWGIPKTLANWRVSSGWLTLCCKSKESRFRLPSRIQETSSVPRLFQCCKVGATPLLGGACNRKRNTEKSKWGHYTIH
jgi:hypothetical protein